MPPQPHIGCRIPPDWMEELKEICKATGQSESEVLREALALYLKKSKAVTVRSRLDALEQRMSKLTALVTDM
jgi:Arc/MetJ-type ribon-helix-helix transcriptional regulator